jgi:hypothetical protein
VAVEARANQIEADEVWAEVVGALAFRATALAATAAASLVPSKDGSHACSIATPIALSRSSSVCVKKDTSAALPFCAITFAASGIPNWPNKDRIHTEHRLPVELLEWTPLSPVPFASPIHPTISPCAGVHTCCTAVHQESQEAYAESGDYRVRLTGLSRG